LLIDFSDDRLQFDESHLENNDVIGDAYMFLIEKFASDAGKKAGEFFTPKEVSTLLARLTKSAPRLAHLRPDVRLGFPAHQGGPRGRLRQLLALRPGAQRQHLGAGHDEHAAPRFRQRHHPLGRHAAQPEAQGGRRADEVRHRRGQSALLARKVGRRRGGRRPLQPLLARHSAQGQGRLGLHLPHARGGQRTRQGGRCRSSRRAVPRRQRGKNPPADRRGELDEAIIGLPANLFYGTGIPAAIAIFNKAKTTTDVLFIDASREFENGKNQNRLRDEDLDHIVTTYRRFAQGELKPGIVEERYAYVARREEIADNDYNLNIPRYVDTFEEEPEIDILRCRIQCNGA